MGPTAPALRPWHRLAVRLAAVFALLALVTVGVVGVLVRERQKREVEDTVGTQLLNVARIGALLIDPVAHARVQREPGEDSDGYRRLRTALAAIQTEAAS
jgi:hypothetical protein